MRKFVIIVVVFTLLAAVWGAATWNPGEMGGLNLQGTVLFAGLLGAIAGVIIASIIRIIDWFIKK